MHDHSRVHNLQRTYKAHTTKSSDPPSGAGGATSPTACSALPTARAGKGRQASHDGGRAWPRSPLSRVACRVTHVCVEACAEVRGDMVRHGI